VDVKLSPSARGQGETRDTNEEFLVIRERSGTTLITAPVQSRQ